MFAWIAIYVFHYATSSALFKREKLTTFSLAKQPHFVYSFLRPIMFDFKKETATTTLLEANAIEEFKLNN